MMERLTPVGQGIVLLVVAALGFGVHLAYSRFTAPEPMGPARTFTRLAEEAASRNCVLFTATQGTADERMAQATARLIAASVASKQFVKETDTRVVGTVTLPDGREVHVVVSASEVCLPRPSTAPIAPFGP